MKNIVLTLAAMLLPLSGWAQDHQLDINLKKAGAPIPSTLYGIFFEDINYAADGGLYAELVKNRSFEFPNDALQGWKAFGKVEVRNDGPFERNPHYVRLQEPGHPQRWTGLDNEGFFGIGVEEGKAYRFSVWARVPDGGASTLRAEMGHPTPFNMKYIGIGNEQWDAVYPEHLEPFVKAIRAAQQPGRTGPVPAHSLQL